MSRSKFSVAEVAPLFFAILIDILGFGFVYPVLTALFTSSNTLLPSSAPESVRYWYLGVSLILYPLFMFFGSSFMGDLSDRWGRKRVILICMMGLTFGFALMGFGVCFASLTLLFMGRALSGLMGASMPVVLAAISDLSTEENKAVHMSYVALIQSVGFVIGALIGGILSDETILPFFSLSLPYFTCSALSFAAFAWVYLGFKETCRGNIRKSIDFLRLFKTLHEAIEDRAVRLLSISFLFMQMAVSLYLQLILIYFKQRFDYQNGMMGYFNGYLGVWFAIGLIVIIPYAAKRYSIERIALGSLLIGGLSQAAVSFLSGQVSLWLIAIPLSLALQVAYTAMLTSFSNAASQDDQGWVMGITGAVIAISFAITGFTPNLVPLVGTKPLIFFGALLLLLASLLMQIYCKRYKKI